MTSDQRKTIWRFAIIFLVILLGFIAVLGRIIYVQTVERDHWLSVAVHQDPVYQPIPAIRGNILDCNGKPLATTMPTYYMKMDTQADALVADSGRVFFQNLDTLAADLSRILKDKSKAAYKTDIIAAFWKKDREYVVCKSVDYIQREQLSHNPFIKRGRYGSGIYYDGRNERILPFGMLASRTIGGIYAESGLGKSGLEKEFDEDLRGTDGVVRVERIGGRQERTTVQDAQDGLDVVTTIDANLQDIVQKELLEKVKEKNAQWGCCILMETQTGYIRAIANVDRNSDNTFSEALNHAVRRVCPGSTFKTISLMAMMNDGLLKTNEKVRVTKAPLKYDPTKRMKYPPLIYDTHPKDTVYSIRNALAVSSNIALATLVTDKYKGSVTKFIQSLQRLGVPNDVYIEIPGYEKPRIEHPHDTVSISKMSYGYVVEVSPMTTAMYYNAIANNGKMMRPQLVTSVQKNGKDVRTFEPEVINPAICSPEIIEYIQLGLHDVVWDSYLGTASVRRDQKTGRILAIKAQSDIVAIAGKTGTAQIRIPGTIKNGKRKDYDEHHHRMTFVGYFPEDDPQYTCLCMIEDPQPKWTYDAGMDCGRVVKNIAEKVMAYTGCYVYKEGQQVLEKR